MFAFEFFDLLLVYFAFGQQRLHFEDRYHRDEAYEEEHHRQEEADRPEEHREVEDRGVIHAPRRRGEVAVEAHDDDHEPLQPHAHVDEHRYDEDHDQVIAHLLPPEQRRNKHVEEDQYPVDHPVRAEHAVLHHKLLESIAAVPGKEELHRVTVGDDQAGGQHHFAAIADVAHGDEIFAAVELADRDGPHKPHGQAGRG